MIGVSSTGPKQKLQKIGDKKNSESNETSTVSRSIILIRLLRLTVILLEVLREHDPRVDELLYVRNVVVLSYVHSEHRPRR